MAKTIDMTVDRYLRMKEAIVAGEQVLSYFVDSEPVIATKRDVLKKYFGQRRIRTRPGNITYGPNASFSLLTDASADQINAALRRLTASYKDSTLSFEKMYQLDRDAVLARALEGSEDVWVDDKMPLEDLINHFAVSTYSARSEFDFTLQRIYGELAEKSGRLIALKVHTNEPRQIQRQLGNSDAGKFIWEELQNYLPTQLGFSERMT